VWFALLSSALRRRMEAQRHLADELNRNAVAVNG
jgi:hypothetical protein